MPETVRIPLSWANNIPGVSFVDDVEFDVPTLGEIDQAIEDGTLGPEDLETLRDGDFGEFVVDATFADEVADAIVDPIVNEIGEQTGLDIPDTDDLAAGIADELDIGDVPELPNIEGLLEDVKAEIIDAVEEAAVEVDGFVDPVVNSLRADLDALAPQVDNLADAVAREIQVTEEGGVSVSIDGFFGPVGQDIVEGFGGVIQELLDVDDVGIPDVPDISRIVSNELEDFVEDVPGGDLLLNPEEFIDEQIDRLTDDLVSDEALENLEDANEDS